MREKEKHPFPPIINENSKILILGTFPSIDSFKNTFYYGHKRNQFWKILNKIFEENTETIDEKRALLFNKQIALWDIVKSCERKNSADSNLKKCEVNDIPALLQTYPNIKAIFFTGQKAAQVYKQYYKNQSIKTVILPSPSPAYASMSFEEKLEIYKVNIIM